MKIYLVWVICLEQPEKLMEWVTNKKILLCLWGKAKDQQNWKKNLKEKQENYIFVLF